MTLNKTEHLLACLIEEAAEIQKNACKGLRFGLDNHYKDNPDNATAISIEFYEMVAVFKILEDEGIFPKINGAIIIEDKKKRVLEFMRYAEKVGTLESEDTNDN
jgi:hypothetical protein